MASRKTYPKEFKEQAVRLLQKNGNKSPVVRELGIISGMLARWEKPSNAGWPESFSRKGEATRCRTVSIKERSFSFKK